MSRGKHIKLIIGVDGQCSIDAHNFTDASCQKATQQIAAALGGQIDHQRDRPQARLRQLSRQFDMERS